MAKILLVEDDPEIAATVIDWLTLEHHTVDHADNGRDGLHMVRHFHCDLIILDWQLPGMTGIEILAEYRNHGGKTPVLMLTGMDRVDHKEAGLDTGADDYLTKPFELKELSARVRALLRRSKEFVANVLVVGKLSLDTRTFKFSKDGKEIQLLPKEFALMEFLMRHPGQVFSSEAILDRVWKSESDSSPDALRQTIRRLRTKVDSDGEPSVITTVHGLGYKLEAAGERT